MANINFGILDTQSPAKIGNAFIRTPEQQNANMLQVMQMQQLMDQREQAQYTINKARREDTGMAEFGNAIKALGPDPSLLAIAQVFMKHPNPEYQLKGFELQKQARADQGYRDLGPMGVPAARPAVAPAPGSPAVGYEFAADMMANRAALPSFGGNQLAATVAAPAASAAPAAPAAPRTRESRIAEIQPRLALLRPFTKDNPQAKSEYDMLVDEIKELRKPQVLTPGSVFDMPGVDRITAPQLPQQPRQVNLAADLLIPGPNGTMIPNQALIGVKTGLATAGRAPAQPRPEQPPVAVVDPLTGKTVYVSREEALRDRMTPANTVEKPMTQAQRIKYGKDKVSDKDVVTGAFAVTGELEKLTDELVGNPDKKIAPAPGLNSITGYSALTNPLALPKGDARKALQKLDTFKGKIMALGRQLASQEGKLGNMAVQEWKFVSDAVQKLDPAAGNLDEQMRDVVRQSKQYALRQQTKYNDTYADDSTAPPAASPGKWGKAVAE